MTEEIDPSMEETTGESPVMKALRRQIKDLEAELRTRPAEDEVESRLRAKLKREADAAALLIEQGHPSGLAEFMLQKIGDTEITTDVVSSFLQGLGLDTQPAPAESQEQSQSTPLAEVTALSSQVSAAGAGASANNVMERIAKATSDKELAAIMAEAGPG